MRCITCGDEMVCVKALPAEAGLVRGFENITLQCPGCGASESRFVFAGVVTSPAGRAAEIARPTTDPNRVGVSNGADGSVGGQDTSIELLLKRNQAQRTSRTQPRDGVTEKVTLASEPRPLRQRITPGLMNGASAPAWRRAIEKVRIHQADLHQRNEKAKKANRTIDFERAWDGHPGSRPTNRRTAKPWDESDIERLGVGALASATARQGKSVELGTDRALTVIKPITAHNVLPQTSVSKNKLEKLFNSLQDSVRLLRT